MRLYSAPYMGYRVGVRLLFSVCYPPPIFFCVHYTYTHQQCCLKIFPEIMRFKNRPYMANSFLIRCTVLTDTEHIAAVSRMLFPAFNERMTLAYSVSFCSIDFTLPTLRPIFTPFSIANFLPLFRR